jgi:hypothetical protein
VCIHQQVKQLTELDWGRDLGPYFTLPGLIDRLDSLLANTCNLRLIPAHSSEHGRLAGQQQQQPQESAQGGDGSAGSQAAGGLVEWGPHVLHLLLLDAASHRKSQQQQQQEGVSQQVLGHIYLELVSGGFPSCTLLQLPTPTTGPLHQQSTPNTHLQQHSQQQHSQQQHSQQQQQQQQQQSSGQQQASCFTPGSVVLRVPVPAAARVRGFGQQQQQQQQQQPQQGADSSDSPAEVSPLALPGPAALQALLHELGHAVTYLCASQHLQQLLPTVDCSSHSISETDDSSNGNSNGGGSSGRGSSCSSSSPDWLFSAPVGVSGLCLLAGPAVGLDVREVSSHLFEHWVRHPASLRVSGSVLLLLQQEEGRVGLGLAGV